ncbi:hypothetical protein GCM10009801_81840 [Streptomyces albiaxialis]|uniref:Integral membrane protein n=1 Tax=Streptomyces albiaxialis TaxID=329523 RepID=A0ABP5IS34_9ACTN
MTTANEPELYGGWRRSYSLGIATLNTSQTVIVVSTAMVVILSVAFGGVAPLLVTLPIGLVVVTLTVWQRHGMPLLTLLGARLRWQLASWRGETSYRQQFQAAPQCLDLPGMAASTKLVKAERPGDDGAAGLVWNQRTGTFTATMLLQPAGALLAAGSTVKASVRAWADTLAGLADEDGVRAASVTLHITPSSGRALSDHVQDRATASAPALAKQTMRDLVDSSPRASAQLSAWFSLIINPSAGVNKPKNPAEAAAETLRTLDGVDLAGSGADVLRVASDQDVKRLVRAGFNPEDLDAPGEEIDELVWHEVGPVAAEDGWEEYRHDGSVSVSWVLRAAPRRHVPYDVLLRLLSPGQFQRRVTLAYRILPSDEGAAVAEREVNAAQAREDYRQRTRRAATRREKVDAQNADRTALEEATGSAIVQWSVYITTTVQDRANLPAARREVEKAARSSGGMRIRPAYGGQAAGLLVGLPLGINPLL